MSRHITRVIFLIGFCVAICAPLLYVVSGAHIHIDWTSKSITGGNPVVLALAEIADIGGSSIIFVAYLSAIIQLIRLRRWGWVIAIPLTVFVAFLVYLLRGPQERLTSAS
jgi:hypothetical protein